MAADERRSTPIGILSSSALIGVHRRPFVLLASGSGFRLRLAVDRDVSRVEPGGQRDGEGLAFGLSDPQQALPVLGEELPVVEARGRRLVIAPGLYFLAQPVHPGRPVEIERVGRILPLVHLRQIVLAQAEILRGSACRKTSTSSSPPMRTLTRRFRYAPASSTHVREPASYRVPRSTV